MNVSNAKGRLCGSKDAKIFAHKELDNVRSKGRSCILARPMIRCSRSTQDGALIQNNDPSRAVTAGSVFIAKTSAFGLTQNREGTMSPRQ